MIVVAGESLIDLLVRPDGTVDPTAGGGPYNVARTIGRLGGSVAFLGRLSTDRFGRRLRAHLVADGVDLALAATTDDPTTLALAELDDGGAATYRFDVDGTSAPGLQPADLPATLPAGLAAVHLGTLGLLLEPIATTLEGWLGSLPPDVLVMVDPNCRPSATRDPEMFRARMARILARADVVKVSTDDLAFLLPGRDPSEAIAAVRALGARTILMTDGGRSVRITNDTAMVDLPVPQVPVVDTVGAGDAFGGGFLAEWIARGRGRVELADIAALEQAAGFAIRVAAVTVQRPGADPPTRSELDGGRATR